MSTAKRQKRKTCENCLWHWPSLMPGEEGIYRCYKPQSPFYHDISKTKCQHFEKRVVDMRCRELENEEYANAGWNRRSGKN